MDNLPADVIRKTALELGPRDVLSLCLTNKKFKESVCNSPAFWRNKIQMDYPNQTSLVNITKMFQENPKNFYMILTMNSKIIEITKNEFPGTFGLYMKIKEENEMIGEDDFTEEDQLKIAAELTRELSQKFLSDNLVKRGDVFHLYFTDYPYGNTNKLLWDGEKVVTLDYAEDVNGSSPFIFPEFRPDYFMESVDSKRVKISEKMITEMEKNFDVETQTSYISDRYEKYPIKLKIDRYGEFPFKIKFNRIFLKNNNQEHKYLIYDRKKKFLLFYIDIDVDKKYDLRNKTATFSIKFDDSRFKDSFKEVVLDSDSSYVWEEDVLKVTSPFKIFAQYF